MTPLVFRVFRWTSAALCAALTALPCHGAQTLVVSTTALVAPPVPACSVHETVLHSGNTLSGALAHWDVPQSQALSWNARLPANRRARGLRPGDRIRACISGRATNRRLVGLEVCKRHERCSVLGEFPKPAGPEPVVKALFKPPAPSAVDGQVHRVAFHLHGPLDVALKKHHVSPVEISVIHAWKHDDAELPAHLPTGTRVGLLLSHRPKSSPRLLRLRISWQGEAHDLFPYVDADGRRWALNRTGTGILHLPLETPVDYTRISSGWGWREQPIKHVPEFHHGIDYAAPMGTAVHAAADGVVRFRGWHGEYGRLVILQNAPGAQTRYGHLSRIAADIHDGSRVKAGQVIGYVGSTGLSTGPHLYFELWVHDLRVDPLTAKLNLAVRLAGQVLRSFNRYTNSIDKLHPALAAADIRSTATG